MTLRPLTMKDDRNFYHASWDEKVYKYLPGYYCDNIEKARKVITKLTTNPKIRAYVIGTFSIDFAGVIVIVEKSEKEVEISYFIDEKFRHKGLCAQALEELIYMYHGYKICFQIDPLNRFSLKIMRKYNAVKDDEYNYHIDTN